MVCATPVGTASLTLRLVVALLALLVGHSVAFALCEEISAESYEKCRGNNVVNPATNAKWNCDCNGAQCRIDCIACTYQYCVAHTSAICRYRCTNDTAAYCDSNNGCRGPWGAPGAG